MCSIQNFASVYLAFSFDVIWGRLTLAKYLYSNFSNISFSTGFQTFKQNSFQDLFPQGSPNILHVTNKDHFQQCLSLDSRLESSHQIGSPQRWTGRNFGSEESWWQYCYSFIKRPSVSSRYPKVVWKMTRDSPEVRFDKGKPRKEREEWSHCSPRVVPESS